MHRTDPAVRATLLCATALVLNTSAVVAQLPWEAPQMLGPHSPAGFSFLAVDYGLDPNPGIGGVVVWRSGVAGRSWGLRAGAAQGIGARFNAAVGVDVARPILRASPPFPLDLMWTAGIGGSWGESLEGAMPVGVTMGRSFSSERLRFDPYTAARAVLELRSDRSAGRAGAHMGLVIDVGADFFVGRSQTLALRTAVALGDRPAASVGIHVAPRRNTTAAQRLSPASPPPEASGAGSKSRS